MQTAPIAQVDRARYVSSGPYRIEVMNVPQYLHHEEFRIQFAKCNGFLESGETKDASGYVHCATCFRCPKLAWTRMSGHRRLWFIMIRTGSSAHCMVLVQAAMSPASASLAVMRSVLPPRLLRRQCSCACRQHRGWFVDFDSPQNAQRCMDAYNAWKGWGPKGLAFNVIGPVSIKRTVPGMRSCQTFQIIQLCTAFCAVKLAAI
jgi:hypothetical protein